MRACILHIFGVSLGALLACDALDPQVGAERPPAAVVDASFADDDGGVDAASRPVSFARDIRPLFSRGNGPPSGCKVCHDRAAYTPQGIDLGGLDMTTLGSLRKGGISSGRRIVIAGNPDASVIIQKLEGTYGRGAQMPKDQKPWSTQEIALLRRWIAEGAQGADNE